MKAQEYISFGCVYGSITDMVRQFEFSSLTLYKKNKYPICFCSAVFDFKLELGQVVKVIEEREPS